MALGRIDDEAAWWIWRDGWQHGRIARQRRTMALYEPRPPECDRHGGPCIGRDECGRERGQQN